MFTVRFTIEVKEFITSCPLLDVSILNFNGVLLNDKAVLKWTTQNENSLLGYEIERSVDGIHFTKVGKVEARKGNGAFYVFNDQTNVVNTSF